MDTDYIKKFIKKLKKNILDKFLLEQNDNTARTKRLYNDELSMKFKKIFVLVFRKIIYKIMENVSTEIIIFRNFKHIDKNKNKNFNITVIDILKKYFNNVSFNVIKYINDNTDNEYIAYRKAFLTI